MPVANLLAMALGFVVAAIGVLSLVAPSILLEFGRTMQSPSVLYVVAAVRIGFGVILLWAATNSRTPRTLIVLGILIVIAGVVTPFLGRTGGAFDWWSTSSFFARAWPIAAVGLGLFIAYTSSPQGST